jgi:Bacterial mobilisation protein (MobC)
MHQNEITLARHCRITIRFTHEEAARLNADAATTGLCLSAYVRLVLLHVEPPRAARMLGQLGKIGSNLNQIARSTNLKTNGVALMPFVERDLARSLADLQKTRNAVLRALGRDP